MELIPTSEWPRITLHLRAATTTPNLNIKLLHSLKHTGNAIKLLIKMVQHLYPSRIVQLYWYTLVGKFKRTKYLLMQKVHHRLSLKQQENEERTGQRVCKTCPRCPP
jgi:hypothetical protein